LNFSLLVTRAGHGDVEDDVKDVDEEFDVDLEQFQNE
jgi:hypothetical protein